MKSKSSKLCSLFLIIVLSLMLVFTTVSASVDFKVEVTDLKNGIINISGTTDASDAESVNILVLNPDYSVDDALTDADAVQYQWTADVADGSFSATLPLNLPDDFEKGIFNVYVGGNKAGKPSSKAFTFSSFEKSLENAKGIYSRITSADVDINEAGQYLKEAAGLLSVYDAFGSVSSYAVTSQLAEWVKENPIDFGEDIVDEEEKLNTEIAAIKTLVKEINRISVLQAFREGKSEHIFDNAGKLKVDDYINLSGRVDAKTTLIDLLENITAEGVKEINNSLMGVTFENEDELAELYAFSIILNGIKYNKKMGIEYVSDILTKDNVSFAGLNIPDYLALDDPTDANSEIIKNKSSFTKANLASKIEDAADIEENTESSKPTGGTSGGSFGGASKVTVMQPVESIVPNVFNDIDGYSWANEAILNLASKGIIAGIGNGQFNPAGQLTREQAVKIVCLALGFTTDETSESFADEVSGAWYAPYLAIARANGIANGQGDNIFGVGNPISRQDFAVMLYRALNISDANAELSFADSDSISPYAKSAVAYLASRKVINGYTDGTFKPTAPISRAEAAKLVYELVK